MGRRLGELTKENTKCMVAVNGRVESGEWRVERGEWREERGNFA